MSRKSESKYFSYLSGLTVKELRDIARERGLYGYTALRKANLIRFLDKRSRVIGKCVERRMFPDAMKTWVELFAPNKSTAEHYTQVIMSTLSNMSYFEKKKSVTPRKTRRSRRRRHEVSEASLDTESSDEDIGDNWKREASDHESDNDSVDVSWYVNDDDSDRESDNDSDEIDDSWRERMELVFLIMELVFFKNCRINMYNKRENG